MVMMFWKTAVIQLIIMLAMFILLTLLNAGLIAPFNKGFYCNDESIRYPVRQGTISLFALLFTSIMVPLILILLTEIFVGIRFRRSFRESGKVLWWFFAHFVYGFLLVALVTQSIKELAGRLRPNFMAVCRPKFPKSLCDNYTYIMIDQFVMCQPLPQLKNFVKETRRSFPSGHASISAYAAVFIALYVAETWRVLADLNVLKFCVILAALLSSVLCGVTRVNDNMHHPSDVVTGLILGGVMAAALWKVGIKRPATTEPIN